ncbi:MAG: hypothetical protein Q7T82_09440 [Armatimonadota bacterium]|nr:hypothetical protein [Armatimonadota bacterium]
MNSFRKQSMLGALCLALLAMGASAQAAGVLENNAVWPATATENSIYSYTVVWHDSADGKGPLSSPDVEATPLVVNPTTTVWESSSSTAADDANNKALGYTMPDATIETLGGDTTIPTIYLRLTPVYEVISIVDALDSTITYEVDLAASALSIGRIVLTDTNSPTPGRKVTVQYTLGPVRLEIAGKFYYMGHVKGSFRDGATYRVRLSPGLNLANKPNGVPGVVYCPDLVVTDPPSLKYHFYALTPATTPEGDPSEVKLNDLGGPVVWGASVRPEAKLVKVIPTSLTEITITSDPAELPLIDVTAIYVGRDPRGTNYAVGGQLVNNYVPNPSPPPLALYYTNAVFTTVSPFPSGVLSDPTNPNNTVWVVYTRGGGESRYGKGGAYDQVHGVFCIEGGCADNPLTPERDYQFPNSNDPYDPFHPDDAAGTTAYVFRVWYSNVKNMPPYPWLPTSVTPEYTLNTGVVLFLDKLGTGDYQPYFMQKVDETDNDYTGWGCEYIYRVEPSGGFQMYDDNPDAQFPCPWHWPIDNMYEALSLGRFHYYFAGCDDYLMDEEQDWTKRAFIPNERVRVTDRQYGSSPNFWTMQHYPPYSTSDWFGSNNLYYADIMTWQPGEDDGWYPYRSTEHPIVRPSLTAPTAYEERIFLGTLEPYYFAYNPNYRYPGHGSSVGFAHGYHEFAQTSAGKASTVFTFTVKYKSQDPDVPYPDLDMGISPKMIRVYINNAPDHGRSGSVEFTPGMPMPADPHVYVGYDMEPIPGQTMDYARGVLYRFRTTLPKGPHTYYFEASDGLRKAHFPVRPDGRLIVNNQNPQKHVWYEDENVPGDGPPTDPNDPYKKADAWNNDHIPGPYVNTTPVLSNPTVTPTSGTQGTAFHFTITYSDGDNQRPYSGWMYLQTRDGGTLANGGVIMVQMYPSDPSAPAYPVGPNGYLKFKNGVDYYADLSARESLVLQPGTRRFKFEFEDDWGYATNVEMTSRGELVQFPEGGTNWVTGPVITTVGGPTLTNGHLSDDLSATSATLWSYTVTYSHPNNKAPSYVNVYIGKRSPQPVQYTLQRVRPTDATHVALVNIPVLSVDGVWTSASTTGTNYLDSFDLVTGILTLSQDLPDQTKDVYVTYTAEGITWTAGNPMVKRDPADMVYTDGVVYQYETRLGGAEDPGDPVEHYVYCFEANDGTLSAVYSPTVSGSAMALLDQPEPFVDMNANSLYDPGELYTDVNANGVWDSGPEIPGVDIVADGNHPGIRDIGEEILEPEDAENTIYPFAWKASGVIGAVESVPTTGGTGYAIGDVLSVTGGIGGRVEVVETSSNNAVAILRLYATGSGYTIGAGQATSGGSGTGCTIEITSIAPTLIVGPLPISSPAPVGVIPDPQIYKNGVLLQRDYVSISSPRPVRNMNEVDVDTSEISRIIAVRGDRDVYQFIDYYNEPPDGANSWYDKAAGVVHLGKAMPPGVQARIEYFHEGLYYIDYVDGKLIFRQPNDPDDIITADYWFCIDGPLAIGHNTPPTLTGGRVTPSVGNSTEDFTYTVTYKDTDGRLGQAPQYVRVYIDSQPYNMTSTAVGTPDYTQGVTYRYITKLATGFHRYHFEASDGSGYALFDAGGPRNSPEPIREITDIQDPFVNDLQTLTLGYPNPGTTPRAPVGQAITYCVIYTDTDGDPPKIGYPMLWVDNATETLITGTISASGVTASTITDTTKTWTADQLKGKVLQFTSGSAKGKTHVITTNTANTITVGASALLTDGVAAGDTYQIGGANMRKRIPSESSYAARMTPFVNIGATRNTVTVNKDVVSGVLGVFDTPSPNGVNYYSSGTGGAYDFNTGVITLGTPLPAAVTTAYVYHGTGFELVVPTLLEGSHQYHFSAVATVSGVDMSVRLPAPGITPTEFQGPVMINQAPPGNRAPALDARNNSGVSFDVVNTPRDPATGRYHGRSGQQYAFQVRYRDADNNPPSYHDGVQGYCRVVIEISGAAPQTLVLSTTSTDFATGAIMNSASINLTPGTYRFHFEASDGWVSTRFPTSSTADYTLIVNTKPVLSNPTVSPIFGNRGTMFTYSVTYTDADGQAPGSIYVRIDDLINRNLTWPTGANFRTGAVCSVNVRAADLPNPLYVIHSCRFFAADSSLDNEAADPTSILSQPEVVDQAHFEDPLVSPDTGTVDTVFTYSVRYFGPSLPTSVKAVIDGVEQSTEMTKDPNDNDPTDGNGVGYTYTRTLSSSGAHTYTFKAMPGNVVYVPTMSGPTVPASLTLTPSANPVDIGQAIDVAIALEPAISADIEIVITAPDGAVIYDYILTDGNGDYTIEDMAMDQSGEWTIDAHWAGDATNDPLDGQLIIDVTAPTHTVTANRYDMVCPPVYAADGEPDPLFGQYPDNSPSSLWIATRLQITRWSPAEGVYKVYGRDPTFPRLNAGSAFWVKPSKFWAGTSNTYALEPFGRLVDQTQSYTLTLPRGWNQFGSVFMQPIPWSAVEVVYNTQKMSLSAAARAGLIRDYAWGYDGTQYFLVHATYETANVRRQLEPWIGYWIRVLAVDGCELVIPAPGGGGPPPAPGPAGLDRAVHLEATPVAPVLNESDYPPPVPR